uniref:Uncharacterized protein n=1 Tax=Anguilla anguilla TaxID=7936 RepID=A0A0E9VJA8_ANGAN
MCDKNLHTRHEITFRDLDLGGRGRGREKGREERKAKERN